jgi:hypothetical protein
MNKNFISGFIKAAKASALPEEEIVSLFKRAYANNITEQDLASIREALHGAGVNPGYNDPTGYLSNNYNQAILAARNNYLNKDPNSSGVYAGLSAAVPGSFVGGAAGNIIGRIHGRPGKSAILNAIRKKLPKTLGWTGALAGGLLTGIPAHEQKKQTISGFQKLNDPANVERLARAIQADKALLSS